MAIGKMYRSGKARAAAIESDKKKSTSTSSTSTNSTYGGSSTVNVGSTGTAPSGQQIGTVVKTAGGDYKIVDKSTPGAVYNPASGYYSIKVGSTPTTTTPSTTTSSPPAGYAPQTVNVGAGGTAQGGLQMGTVVKTAGGDYRIVDKNTPGAVYNPASGYYSVKVGATPPPEQPLMPTISMDDTMQRLADMLYGNQKPPTLDPTLSYEEALARARANINPAYAQAFDQMIKQLDQNALRTGFFGQLPTEALKRQAAGSLEVDKLQTINQLASQLFGQSEDTAYKKLDAKQQEYQNKLNMMLQLLNLYSAERSYADNRADADRDRAFKEAGYTGMYNGNPTLDFLEYQRLLANQKK